MATDHSSPQLEFGIGPCFIHRKGTGITTKYSQINRDCILENKLSPPLDGSDNGKMPIPRCFGINYYTTIELRYSFWSDFTPTVTLLRAQFSWCLFTSNLETCLEWTRVH